MPADREVEVNLAQSKSLVEWKPQVGDFVFFNGFWSKWIGVVNNIGNPVSIIEGGNPFLLLNYTQAEMAKHTRRIDIKTIRSGSRGKYGVLRNEMKTTIWYI